MTSQASVSKNASIRREQESRRQRTLVWPGVQFIMEQAPHIRTFLDTNSHLKKGDKYIQVSQRENKKGNFEVQHSSGEIGGMRGAPVFKKYKSSQDAQTEFDRLCSEALEHGCSWEHNESIHGRIVIDFTNWPSIALW